MLKSPEDVFIQDPFSALGLLAGDLVRGLGQPRSAFLLTGGAAFRRGEPDVPEAFAFRLGDRLDPFPAVLLALIPVFALGAVAVGRAKEISVHIPSRVHIQASVREVSHQKCPAFFIRDLG